MNDENEAKALAERFYAVAVASEGTDYMTAWDAAQHAAREALRWRDETRPPPAGLAVVPADDAIEAAYWDFDARHKGYGPHKMTPQSERDAFKWAVRALLAATPAQQPAAAAPEGWRVMWFSSSIRPHGERWEIYDPEGNGGAVSAHDVRDDMVRGLLDALAAVAHTKKQKP